MEYKIYWTWLICCITYWTQQTAGPVDGKRHVSDKWSVESTLTGDPSDLTVKLQPDPSDPCLIPVDVGLPLASQLGYSELSCGEQPMNGDFSWASPYPTPNAFSDPDRSKHFPCFLYSFSWFKTSTVHQEHGRFCEIPKGMDKYLTCRKDIKLQVCLIDDQMVNPCWDKPSVIIIGAGMAGLAAAQRLMSCGISDVTILEATDRPGGRIHSCWMGDNIVDVGADFIEGASISNSVYAIAALEGMLEPPVVHEYETQGLAITSDGEIVCPFVTMAATCSFRAIVERTRRLFTECPPGTQCGSLCDFIGREIERNIMMYPCKYRSLAARVMISRLIDLKSRIGADLKDVSACQFGAKKELSGGNVRIRTGMVGLLAAFLKNMTDCDKIRYCKPVGKINWTDEPTSPRVSVYCCDGDKFCADYVIFTPSLGVLKEKADCMFDPPLPKSKMDAIKTMGFGNINHVYYEYDKPFWIWNEGNVILGWNNDGLYDPSCCWLTGIGSIRELPSSQQILQVTVAGVRANYIERASDAELATHITQLYRKTLRNPTIPYPANVLKSAWAESPYFRGARSYYNLKTTVETQCDIARPVPAACGSEIPVLLFAGEHTAVGQHGTIHGARASGIREAERILDLTRKFQGAPKYMDDCMVAKKEQKSKA